MGAEMALQIIDRRLAGKNKSVGNRERFVRRYKAQIAEAVRRAVAKRDIRHIEQAENITIPRKDIQEPSFHHGQGVCATPCTRAIPSMCEATALPGPRVAQAVAAPRPVTAARAKTTSRSP